MEQSPFRYQGPLEPDQVHGRDELLADLIDRVTARRVTALVAPRRFGKTSLLRRVARDLSELSTVWVDLYEVTSMVDLLLRFDRALERSSGHFHTEARSYAASLRLNLGLASADFQKKSKARPDADARLWELLDVLVTTAQRLPTLLVIDEFSSIGEVRGAAGKLRTALQHHYTDLGLVFAGSKPSMMRKLFTDRVEPFFAQADLVNVGLLAPAAVVDVIMSGFADSGRDAGPVPSKVLAFAAGHPQRTMQLADAAWRHTPPGETADTRIWETAAAEVRRQAADSMERLFSQFKTPEQSVLRIVAADGALFGREAEALELSASSAQNAREQLIADGDLVDDGGVLAITDPLLGDWLSRTLPL